MGEEHFGKKVEGDNAAGGGQDEAKVKSGTPENASGKVNPSAPGETGTTPKTNGK